MRSRNESATCSRSSVSTVWKTARRRNFPAASNSASPLPARLINEPKVMLLDEPLSNLDAKLRVQMRSEIKALQRRTNITTIFVTHDQAEALAISDQIAVMHGGMLLEVGAPHQLYSRPTRRFTATFLGLTNLIDGKIVELYRRWAAGKNPNQKRPALFHPGAWTEEGPSGGDFDPAGKHSAL